MLMAKKNVYMNITSTFLSSIYMDLLEYFDNFVKNESLLTNVLVADEITRNNYQNDLNIISCRTPFKNSHPQK